MAKNQVHCLLVETSSLLAYVNQATEMIDVGGKEKNVDQIKKTDLLLNSQVEVVVIVLIIAANSYAYHIPDMIPNDLYI